MLKEHVKFIAKAIGKLVFSILLVVGVVALTISVHKIPTINIAALNISFLALAYAIKQIFNVMHAFSAKNEYVRDTETHIDYYKNLGYGIL